MKYDEKINNLLRVKDDVVVTAGREAEGRMFVAIYKYEKALEVDKHSITKRFLALKSFMKPLPNNYIYTQHFRHTFKIEKVCFTPSLKRKKLTL